MSVIRLVIADDHPLVLRGIGDFLDAQDGLAVVARCADGAQALEAIRTLKPDIAVLDLFMPGMGGLKVLADANKENLATRIVFLSAAIRSRDIVQAMSEGAYGLLRKDCDPDELLHCVRGVTAGQKFLPYKLLEHTRAGEEKSGAAVPIGNVLTPSEWKVVMLVAEGLANKDIARKLEITEGTVKTHLNHIFQKTGVTNRTALANLALQQIEYESLR
jgi:two-component system nitrate/nitrite response regulator NarL